MEESAAPAPAAPPPAPLSIGQRLRAGRERSGLSVAAAAEKLHLDNRVIEALEADRFAELGASVYVRGHLRRYGDFVGEQGAELVNAYTARESRPPPPDLTQVPHAERRSDPRRLVTPLIGLGCALVLAIAIWWVLAGSRSATPVASGPATSSEGGAAAPAVAAAAPATTAPPAGTSPTVRVADAAPAAAPANAPDANSAPREAAPDASPAPARVTRLTLELSGESWVEVYDSRGERLYYDVASAGSVQSIEGRGPLRVVLGNAAGVSVQVDGQQREIPTNALNGEGARFVVNRSGSLSRARP
jgi:cytoskeleton protein RodZ